MEYILNKTPIRTTNGFKINELKIDLNLPTEFNYHDFIISNDGRIKINTSLDQEFDSKIGLHFDKSYKIDIIVPSGIKAEEPIKLVYEFSNSDNLIDLINIIYEDNSSANIILEYRSLDNEYSFHHLKEVVTLNENSNANITIINNLNKNSINLMAIENNSLPSSNITTNIIDLGCKTRVYNTYSETFDNAYNYLNSIYIGKDNDLIDINFHSKNIGKKSVNEINVQGLLDGNAKKSFKGTIDFISGAVESIGKENENCILMSDTAVSRSLPMLLCGEENVVGSHSVSTGKIDNDKLFYLMSRGYTKDEASKLILKSNFYPIIMSLPSEDIREYIIDKLDSVI